MQPRIVFFHPHFLQPGGASKFVVETAKLLAEDGYAIEVIATHIPQGIRSANKSDSLHWHELGCPTTSSIWFWLGWPIWWWRVWKLTNQLVEESRRNLQTVILFPQVFPANWWAFLIKKFRPEISLLWMCQEPSAFIHSEEWRLSLPTWWARLGLLWLRPIWSAVDIWLAKSSDYVLANSQFTRAQALKIYNFKTNQVGIAHPGADLNTFKANSTRRQPRVVCTARHTKFKKIDLLLRAWQIVINSGKIPLDSRLRLIGQGEATHELKHLAHQLQIEKSVDWLGSISTAELHAELSQAKVYVHPTQNEPFGISVVEALASGTPAVVFAGGGPAEIVEDGKCGTIIQSSSVEDLAKEIILLLLNPNWSKLSKASIERSTKFSWTETTKSIRVGLNIIMNQDY